MKFILIIVLLSITFLNANAGRCIYTGIGYDCEEIYCEIIGGEMYCELQ